VLEFDLFSCLAGSKHETEQGVQYIRRAFNMIPKYLLSTPQSHRLLQLRIRLCHVIFQVATTLDLIAVVVNGSVYILRAFFISTIIILQPTENAIKRG